MTERNIHELLRLTDGHFDEQSDNEISDEEIGSLCGELRAARALLEELQAQAQQPVTRQQFSLTVIRGVEGTAIYLNDYRIAGPKPWGGGLIIQSWNISLQEIIEALICGDKNPMSSKGASNKIDNLLTKWDEHE